MMTWYIKHSYCIPRDIKKLWKARKRGFFKFTETNIALWTICYFLSGTYLWKRSLFIMPWMQHENVQVVGQMTHAWMARVLVRTDPEWSCIWFCLFPKKTMWGLQWTFYLIHVYAHIDHLLHMSYSVK